MPVSFTANDTDKKSAAGQIPYLGVRVAKVGNSGTTSDLDVKVSPKTLPASVKAYAYLTNKSQRINLGTLSSGNEIKVTLPKGYNSWLDVVMINTSKDNTVNVQIDFTPTSAPIDIPITAQGSIQNYDSNMFFGTSGNPIPVWISGAFTGDPGLRFEGTEFYSQYGGRKSVLAFVYSIPSTSAFSTISFKDLVVKFGDPNQVVVNKHEDWGDGGVYSGTNESYHWVGWEDGWTSNLNITFGVLDYSWINGTPISEKKCVGVDDSRVGENNYDSSAALFELGFSYEKDWQYLFSDGTVGSRGHEDTKGTANVVIRLVRR